MNVGDWVEVVAGWPAGVDHRENLVVVRGTLRPGRNERSVPWFVKEYRRVDLDLANGLHLQLPVHSGPVSCDRDDWDEPCQWLDPELHSNEKPIGGLFAMNAGVRWEHLAGEILECVLWNGRMASGDELVYCIRIPEGHQETSSCRFRRILREWPEDTEMRNVPGAGCFYTEWY